jgi:hypothetical protein
VRSEWQFWQDVSISEESGRKRSRFRDEADQDSGGKPIADSGGQADRSFRSKGDQFSSASGMVIGFSGMFSTGV